MKGITALRAGLVMAVILLLSGCFAPVGRLSGRDQLNGKGQIVITLTQGVTPQGVSLMSGGDPVFVRVRVFGSGVDVIEDRAIPASEPREVAIQVPAGTGYTVDAIVYRSKSASFLPISGAGRVEGVSVLAGQTAYATVPVSSYQLTYTAPAHVTAGSKYVVRGEISGPNIWGSRVYFKFDDVPWNSDEEFRPGLSTSAQIVRSGPDFVEILYEGTAPSVGTSTTYYFGFELWTGEAYTRGLPAIVLNAPSVDFGDSLLTMTVKREDPF